MSTQRAHHQVGFTLIELTLVMAISASLAAVALQGFGNLRGQAQFSDAIEQVDQSVLGRRQEALSTVKLSGGGTSCAVPATQCNDTIGRLLTFTPGSSNVTVQTLVTLGTAAPTAGQAVTLLASETSTFTIPWGITYTSSSLGNGRVQVAFVRAVTDGTLATAVSPNGGWSGFATGSYQYGNFASGGAAANLNFTDPSGRQAYLTVDPSSNGVTRVFK